MKVSTECAQVGALHVANHRDNDRNSLSQQRKPLPHVWKLINRPCNSSMQMRALTQALYLKINRKSSRR